MQDSEGYVTTDDGCRLYYRKLGADAAPALRSDAAPALRSNAVPVLVPNAVFMLDDFRRLAKRRTVVFVDPRARGRSDFGGDHRKLAGGIDRDIDDLDAVRRHFGFDRVALLAHSYCGATVALHAARYPAYVERVIQIGPVGPVFGKDYPARLKNADAVYSRTLAAIRAFSEQGATMDPIDSCRAFWKLVQPLYVVEPADVAKLAWDPCVLENERGFARTWTESILPSLEKLTCSARDLAGATASVLTIHGRKDRSAPYGGGVEWACLLPNARLLTVDGGGHLPWIEAPELVFGAIETFLDGEWPAGARKVRSLDDV